MATQSSLLDPRLRRILMDIDSQDRLRADINAGVVAESFDTPAGASKRILCQLARGRAIPEAFRHLGWSRLGDGIYSVTVPIDQIATLASQPEVLYVEAGRALHPQLSSSLPETRANLLHNGAPPFRGVGVIVGIIDFGLDFTLDDFRLPNGDTRVAFLWDQALTPNGAESAPANFPYGVEYSRSQINSALSTANPFATVRHNPGIASHGTHVAGIAAANGRSNSPASPPCLFIGAAPEATIIFVQPTTEAGIGTFADSVRVSDAIAYIFDKASSLSMPCVINMSLGQNGGPHDGESLVERAIDAMLLGPGRAFVCAAGNEHFWSGHASGQIAANQSRTLGWQMGIPGVSSGTDLTANEMEIWYSSRDRFDVRVIAPSGNATPFVPAAQTQALNLPSGNSVFIDSLRFHRLNGDALIYIEVSGAAGAPIETGVWKVELRAMESLDGRFDAWIERDRRSSINNFADQSRFVPADFDAQATLGTPATGYRSIAVANYDHQTTAVELSSSRGPTRDARAKPEVAAPGADIVASCSLGNRPHPTQPATTIPIRVPKTGTSMSAPHVAGIIALLLEKEPNLTAEQIRALFDRISPPRSWPKLRLRPRLGLRSRRCASRAEIAHAVDSLNAHFPQIDVHHAVYVRHITQRFHRYPRSYESRRLHPVALLGPGRSDCRQYALGVPPRRDLHHRLHASGAQHHLLLRRRAQL